MVVVLFLRVESLNYLLASFLLPPVEAPQTIYFMDYFLSCFMAFHSIYKLKNWHYKPILISVGMKHYKV